MGLKGSEKGLRQKIFSYMQTLGNADENDLKIVMGKMFDKRDFTNWKAECMKWSQWVRGVDADTKRRIASMSHDNVMLAAIELGFKDLYPELIMYEEER